MVLGAADIRINYRSLKSDVGSLTIDLYEQGAPAGSFTLDDLSLPIVSLPGKLPELSVGQLSVALHPVANSKTGNLAAARATVAGSRQRRIPLPQRAAPQRCPLRYRNRIRDGADRRLARHRPLSGQSRLSLAPPALAVQLG